MAAEYHSILKEAEHVVLGKLENLAPEMTYHTADHTKRVLQAVNIIGENEKLSDDDMLLVSLSAWFHDVGYVTKPDDHETESAKIAESFLSERNVEPEKIDIIKEAILATRLPQSPKSKIARILCDADMSHLAAPDYFEQAELLRVEKKWLLHTQIPKTDFHHGSVLLFSNHNYHTNYGQTVLEAGKRETLKMIHDKIDKANNKPEKSTKALKKEIEKLEKKLEKEKGYSRGVESMFRLTARNQINLSSIADNKSNILISVNTIIISIVLTVLFSNFGDNPALVPASLLLVTTGLITIIFAILATRPHISSGRFTKEDIKEKKVNLLFFGNFYDMSLDEYEWALKELMKDDDYLYATMIKDQHSLGIVLARKYKLLRKAYNIFMIGLIISVIAFVLAFSPL